MPPICLHTLLDLSYLILWDSPTRERESRNVESQQVACKEKLASHSKGKSERAHKTYKPGSYQEPLDAFRNLSDACADQLTNIYWTLSKWPSLCGVYGDITVSKTRHDVYPPGASSLVGETEDKQGRNYVHEDGECVYKSQRLTGHKGVAPGEIYMVAIESWLSYL